VAEIHAQKARENRDDAVDQRQVADGAHRSSQQNAVNAAQRLVNAQNFLANGQRDLGAARRHAAAAAVAHRDVEAAQRAANDSSTLWRRASGNSDLALAATAMLQALAARQTAQQRLGDAQSEQRTARQSADAIIPTIDRIQTQLNAARAASQGALDDANATKTAADAARASANAASQNAADAGRLLDLAATIDRKQDLAKVKQEYEATRRLLRDVDIHLAEDRATAAKELANEEEADADERIAVAQARDRIERARAVQGPPSPFYFASAAHFPIREFGPRGEVIDRDGLLIYEDMKFSFDRDGNYRVDFRASRPNVPATVRLQFLIQPRPGGPWYTVTLAPIDFASPNSKTAKRNCTSTNDCSDASDAEENQCCGPARKCFCEGHSEILRRCYAEMGKGATIRRTGSARFGYGLDALSRATAY
jgi:hypothetical protein